MTYNPVSPQPEQRSVARWGFPIACAVVGALAGALALVTYDGAVVVSIWHYAVLGGLCAALGGIAGRQIVATQ